MALYYCTYSLAPHAFLCIQVSRNRLTRHLSGERKPTPAVNFAGLFCLPASCRFIPPSLLFSRIRSMFRHVSQSFRLLVRCRVSFTCQLDPFPALEWWSRRPTTPEPQALQQHYWRSERGIKTSRVSSIELRALAPFSSTNTQHAQYGPPSLRQHRRPRAVLWRRGARLVRRHQVCYGRARAWFRWLARRQAVHRHLQRRRRRHPAQLRPVERPGHHRESRPRHDDQLHRPQRRDLQLHAQGQRVHHRHPRHLRRLHLRTPHYLAQLYSLRQQQRQHQGPRAARRHRRRPVQVRSHRRVHQPLGLRHRHRFEPEPAQQAAQEWGALRARVRRGEL